MPKLRKTELQQKNQQFRATVVQHMMLCDMDTETLAAYLR